MAEERTRIEGVAALSRVRVVVEHLGTNYGGFVLRARLNVSLPGLEPEVAKALVDAAHQMCPYSKATRGNIEVEINLI